ncbi:MAG: RluA family pseudouridine synthase [Kiritimatiellae bacterium]|nr:RluA family pseudouridine synthase [Kiritimatiellia bacterium]
MIRDVSFTNGESGVRLDAALLCAFPATTRAFVRAALAKGSVTVDGRAAPKGMKLRGGETVRVKELLEAADNLVRPDPSMRPRIVFEDGALLACDKPAGLPVQPLACTETGTLANAVAAARPECRPLGDRPLMAGAIHRIDAGTSGLVLFAKSAQAFEAMRAQFAAQTVEKTYLALVEGSAAVGGTLENDLVHDPSLSFCRMIDAKSNRLCEAEKRKLRPMRAVTNFRPIGRTAVENEERTLLEVKIKTGVTHQIRAQLAMAGWHIINDRLYGAFAVEGMEGHCLHALAASFMHPVSGERTEIRTPLPDWAKI